MTLNESINRGFNLLSVSIVSIAGLAFLPEAFIEIDIPDKIDDTFLFIIGLIAAWWYYSSRDNRYTHSVVPVVFVALALAVKFGGVLVELDDADAVGDDFGGLILFFAATALIVYQYFKVKKLLAENE